MLRTVIEIDREKCNGCGLCVRACHEGAIELVDGKAQLAREHFCDGLGDCLPSCPAGAITFVKREAPDYDAAAVSRAHGETAQLRNFPIQLRLVSEYAPFLDGASLLIAADCTAFVCPDFFERYARGRVVLIGCPKLDAANYAQKLTEIFRRHRIASILTVRMQVPCCGGLPYAVQTALDACGKDIPAATVVLDPQGQETQH